MTSVTPNALVTTEEVADVLNIFRCFGEAEVIAESMIHPVVGVSGSAPAYVFMFLEAMADAAVLGGMPRAQAYKFAAQAVMGSAKMVLETGKHPGELKDMVCSRAVPPSKRCGCWKSADSARPSLKRWQNAWKNQRS
jgi:pyrroline-5-carboxylate reductase